MGRMVDVDDLVDSRGVADVLHLSQHQSVSVYRKRYTGFPQPVVDMGAGRCLLWLRADIDAWAAQRGRSNS
jgi:predicted DNA-binding transcriptional regulator AlpA